MKAWLVSKIMMRLLEAEALLEDWAEEDEFWEVRGAVKRIRDKQDFIPAACFYRCSYRKNDKLLLNIDESW